MKEYFKTMLLAGIPFGTIMGLFYGILKGAFGGLIGGITVGLIFGLSMSSFAQIQKKRFKKTSSVIVNGQNIIMEGAANHFKGKEGVGGWLCLTPEEIVFKSHKFNIQVHQLSIPVNRIVEAKPALTYGFIPNGLYIKTADQGIERFVVYHRKTWAQNINEMMTSSLSEPLLP